VLDPMCGSGTTPRVACEMGRKYIGIDISHEYCELARQRVRLIEMQPRLFYYDEAYLDSLIEKATKNWAQIKDKDDWLHQIRGNYDT